MSFSQEEPFHILTPQGFSKIEGHIVVTSDAESVAPFSSDQFYWPHEKLESVITADRPVHFLGQYQGELFFALDLESHEVDSLGVEQRSLRSYLGLLPEPLFRLLGRAVQLTNWYSTHQFCGRCGSSTSAIDNERAMACSECGLTYYPRLSPCIMVIITKGDYCLLARNAQWTRAFYSVLAGFIEPGESAEHAVSREVMEEVSLEISGLEYYGSQPWPFPGQLMLGYFAEYQAGEIVVDQVEIAEADWFHYRELPNTPGEFSLSGQLIKAFVQRRELFHKGSA